MPKRNSRRKQRKRHNKLKKILRLQQIVKRDEEGKTPNNCYKKVQNVKKIKEYLQKEAEKNMDFIISDLKTLSF